MKSREITAVALKVVAIYFLFQAVIAIPAMLVVIYRNLEKLDITIFVTAAGIAAAFGLAVGMWNLSKKLIIEQNTTPTDNLVFNMTPIKLEKIILRCMGLYLIITNLRQTIYDAIIIFQYSFSDITPAMYVNVFVDLLILFISLTLMASPLKWLMVIRRIRN
jgi:hypothetical protein